MVDVERIQKINNLALDLVKQGLASDREAAIAQAEKIFKSNDSEGYNSIVETMNKVNGMVQPETKTETKQAIEKKEIDEDDLPKEKIKEILAQNTKFIVGKLRTFQEKVIQLEKEIASLKTKMTYHRLPTASQIVSQKIQAVDEPIVHNGMKPEEIKEPTLNELHENNPRSGNFKENDVSIEKFFYYGK